jgi:hypothetical protein
MKILMVLTAKASKHSDEEALMQVLVSVYRTYRMEESQCDASHSA